jgi:CheY-like chemotaxis protein
LTGITILVVDDNPDLRYVIQVMLEARGATVRVASDGAEAFTMLLEDCPDLVLCDIQMPVMNGIEFARKVRRTPECSRVRLIAMTSFRDDTAYLRSWSAGFDAHLEKPVTIEKLEGVARFLSGPRPPSPLA